MRKIFILIPFALLACTGENCTVNNFKGFDNKNISAEAYSAFEPSLIRGLKPGLIYKFIDRSDVCFAVGKGFSVLSFMSQIDSSYSLKNITPKKIESKIQYGKCYAKCGFMGKTLKYRVHENNYKNIILQIHSSKVIVVDHNDNLLMCEGKCDNIGLKIGRNEYVFQPQDDKMEVYPNLFTKVILYKKRTQLWTHIFYSESTLNLNNLTVNGG